MISDLPATEMPQWYEDDSFAYVYAVEKASLEQKPRWYEVHALAFIPQQGWFLQVRSLGTETGMDAEYRSIQVEEGQLLQVRLREAAHARIVLAPRKGPKNRDIAPRR